MQTYEWRLHLLYVTEHVYKRILRHVETYDRWLNLLYVAERRLQNVFYGTCGRMTVDWTYYT